MPNAAIRVADDAAVSIQRWWRCRHALWRSCRPVRRWPGAYRHHAAARIQRAWRVSSWRRRFVDFSERDLGWVGSLRWLQEHRCLYGTELAEQEDVRHFTESWAVAPRDREVDPWGSKQLRDHLSRAWYGCSASSTPSDTTRGAVTTVPAVAEAQEAGGSARRTRDQSGRGLAGRRASEALPSAHEQRLAEMRFEQNRQVTQSGGCAAFSPPQHRAVPSRPVAPWSPLTAPRSPRCEAESLGRAMGSPCAALPTLRGLASPAAQHTLRAMGASPPPPMAVAASPWPAMVKLVPVLGRTAVAAVAPANRLQQCAAACVQRHAVPVAGRLHHSSPASASQPLLRVPVGCM